MEFTRQNNLVRLLIDNFDNFESIIHICNPKDALNEINVARYSRKVTPYLSPDEDEKLQFMQANILCKGIYTYLNEASHELEKKNVNFINHDPLIWQINASMKHLDYKYFKLFIEESMKIIAKTYTNASQPTIFQKLKTVSSSILVSFMNYASYCPEENKDEFYKLFKSRLKSFDSEKIKSKVSSIMEPIDFFTKDKNSLTINFYEHFSKTPEKLNKFVEFAHFYFNCSYYPNQKAKLLPEANSKFTASEKALHSWLTEKIAHLGSEKQQIYLEIFSQHFKVAIDNAQKSICKKLLQECKKPITNTAVSAHDLRNKILEAYKCFEHIDFKIEVLNQYLSLEEISFIQDFVRAHHYLGVGVGYLNQGKQMPINKLIKLCFMDKERLNLKYQGKYKELIKSLNLDISREKDFKTFFLLGFGNDLLESAAAAESKHDNWPFRKLQKLLPNQHQKVEKKYIDKNLASKKTDVKTATIKVNQTDKKFKI